MQDLHSLKIDKSLKSRPRESRWAQRWILGGIALFLLLGAARMGWEWYNRVPEVRIARAARRDAGSAGNAGRVVLNATGYIIAHHKIQLASKVVGKVAWIGVEKGDRVKEGQVIVRLEDDEYRAQLQQAKGQLASLQARLSEQMNGSRPEEIAVAKANLEEARADLVNARINLERAQQLASAKVYSRQALDDATARFHAQEARVASLEKAFELVRIGPRQEVIEQTRAQIDQFKGLVAFHETQLNNTVIRAPISGTILERVVEKGEFVTTSFVGERGAKGYVVSLADLNDLQVELDINQNDFAKLAPRQRAVITTDAYKDRNYEGYIEEVSPEANRQKATVQVKVKVAKPDEYLRPEMNASVEFVADAEPATVSQAKPVVMVPVSAVRNGVVFVYLEGRVVERRVRTGNATAEDVRIEEGLIGGEDLVMNPPPTLKNGDRVKVGKS